MLIWSAFFGACLNETFHYFDVVGGAVKLFTAVLSKLMLKQLLISSVAYCENPAFLRPVRTSAAGNALPDVLSLWNGLCRNNDERVTIKAQVHSDVETWRQTHDASRKARKLVLEHRQVNIFFYLLSDGVIFCYC